MDKIPLQTYLNTNEVKALARVEVALRVKSAPGRQSPTGLKNVKASLALCVRLAGWLVDTGRIPPAAVIGDVVQADD